MKYDATYSSNVSAKKKKKETKGGEKGSSTEDCKYLQHSGCTLTARHNVAAAFGTHIRQKLDTQPVMTYFVPGATQQQPTYRNCALPAAPLA